MAAERSLRDIRTYRNDFPVLQGTMHGKKLAYLDSGASAQKPQVVMDAMRAVEEHGYSNIHRGLFEISQNLTAAYEEVRGKVSAFIGAPSDKTIVFTRNSTEGINLVAQSYGRNFLKEGDEVILSVMEHHANIVPWQLLRDQIGIVLKIIPMSDDGVLDLDAYRDLLSDRTRIVSVVQISNSLGTINPVKEVISIAKVYNSEIVTVVDGSQSVVHGAVDVVDLGCDFFVFTGHKIYGPNGIGVLYGRTDILEKMPPYQGGGDMIERVRFEKTTYAEPPFRFEAGTPAIVPVIGLGAAIDYVSGIGFEAISEYEALISDLLHKAALDVDGVRIYGQAPKKAGIVSFTADWAHVSDIGMILDQCGVAVRTGHHCCMPLMQRLGIDGTARASIGLYTNENDIDQFAEGLKKAKDMFS